MNTKKTTALLLALCLALALLSGCSDNNSDAPLRSFSADTLNGGVFTQEDISGKDLTIINFWATFCGPCLAEMPDLAAYAKSLPERVQLITVCLDGSGDVEGAKAIIQEAGFEGPALLGTGDETFQSLCGSVQAVPTTIFVDGKGNLVGQAVIGGQADLATSFTEAANKALKEIGKAEISLENA